MYLLFDMPADILYWRAVDEATAAISGGCTSSKALLNAPMHQLARRGREGPIGAIYGGHSANDEAQKYYLTQNGKLRWYTQQIERHPYRLGAGKTPFGSYPLTTAVWRPYSK